MLQKEEKIARARELYLSGCNCAQAVFAAFAPETGLDEATALRLSGGFGGGMGGLRGACGALSGAVMALSAVQGFDKPDLEAKKRLYSRIQAMAKRFDEAYGTLQCAELLRLNGIEASHEPAARTPEYYKNRPCGKYIEFLTGVLADELNAQD